MNIYRTCFFIILILTSLQAQYPIFNEILSFNTLTVQDEDREYTDWIEIYNPSGSPISMAGYSISDDEKRPQKWVFPKITIPSKGFLLVFASGKDRTKGALHTNFKISSKGETLWLFSPEGKILDSVRVPALSADQSYARFGDEWSTVITPTPRLPNSGYLPQSLEVLPAFSPKAGFYSHPIEVSLKVADSLSILYTTDGSNPHLGSSIYQAPISLSKTTVLKARAKDNKGRLGPVVTQSYFIRPKSNLAIVSLSTHPANLFDDDIGIYVEGNGTKLGGYPDNPVQPPANYWEDWERPAHVELFEPDGRLGFSLDAGIKMFGKTSRKLPQKSFAVFMRRAYGTEELHYPLFPDYPICRFKSFLLRNGGSDNTQNEGGVQFRDGLAARLLYGMDLDFQAYRPCHLYINGEYWGIYNLREKINEHFLASHHGVDPDQVDLLDDYHRLYPLAVQGDASHFNALIDYINSHSLSVQKHADYIAEIMDIKNYLTYMAVQIILANHDGPGHNCKFWRPNTAPGLYRWILFDVDHSFGQRLFIPNYHFAPEDGYKDNTIAYYREEDGPPWPNPPESTFLFRKILENQNFRELFINIICDLMNTRFFPDSALVIYETVQSTLEPEIDQHLQRWGGKKSQWMKNCEVVKKFLQQRQYYLYNHILNEFNLRGSCKLQFHIEPPQSGSITLNSLTIDSPSWKGIYFRGVPISLQAYPLPGYRFSSWNGINALSSILVSLNGDTVLTAFFAKDEASPSLIINEINYNSAADFDTDDWIELYNPHDRPIDISYWKLMDFSDKSAYFFPQGFSVAPFQYIVVCKNQALFQALWGTEIVTLGNLPFGLSSKGDFIALLDDRGNYVDSLRFGVVWPWPAAADGKGAVLALRHPSLDNSKAENWFASYNGGTPGLPNSIRGDAKDEQIERFSMSLSVFPNPVNSSAILFIRGKTTQKCLIKLYDLLGREIQNIYEGIIDQDLFLNWTPPSLPSGIYFVILSANEEKKKCKVILIK